MEVQTFLSQRTELIFVTIATTGGGVLQAGTHFCKENVKFWPILANFGYFVAYLCINIYGIFGALLQG